MSKGEKKKLVGCHQWQRGRLMNMMLSLMTTLMTKFKHDDMARTLDVGIKAIGTHWNSNGSKWPILWSFVAWWGHRTLRWFDGPCSHLMTTRWWFDCHWILYLDWHDDHGHIWSMKLRPKKPLNPQVGHMPIICHGALKIIKVEVEALNEKSLSYVEEGPKTIRSAFAFKS